MLNNHDEVRVAVIGGGNMGSNHIRKYIALPETNLVAIADPNPAIKETANNHNIKYYSDYREMLHENDIQAVSIVVPTPLHYEVASDVMSRGLNCLLEKPITSTVEEGEKLIQIAKKMGVIFTVGHIEHYNPVVIKLKELIDNKSIGEITSIVCQRVGGFPKNEPKSDVIVDLAVHDIGIINYLLGEYPTHIYSHASRSLHSDKVDAAEILLEYDKASGFIQANWVTPIKIRTISITGTKGYVEANYITQELNLYEHNMVRVDTGFESFVHTLGEPKHHAILVEFHEPLERELSSFIRRIKGEKTSYLVDPEEAVIALRTALKAVERYE